jgi:Cu2+-exporting ATPase
MQDGSIHYMPGFCFEGRNPCACRPGASVPADGVVAEGESNVNESMIKGESLPVIKNSGRKGSLPEVSITTAVCV